MSKTYVIQWKSKINGRAGKGTKLFELAEAEQLAHELNRQYPDIEHHVLDIAGPPPETAPEAPVPEAAISQNPPPPVAARSGALSVRE